MCVVIMRVSSHATSHEICEFRIHSSGNSFTEAGTLKKHIHTVHEGNKDHKCKICGKSFIAAQNLKKHIQIVHESCKHYICDICDDSFTEARKLKKHIHSAHKADIFKV